MENNNETYQSTYVTRLQPDSDGPVQKPKKKHTGLIIALSVLGVLIIGAAATFVFAKDIVINKFMLMTKSDKEYFRWVAGREVDAACAAIRDSGKNSGDKQALAGKNGQGNYFFSIKTHTDEKFTDMLNIYPVKDIEMSWEAAFANDVLSFSFAPSYNGNRLLTLNTLFDVGASVIKAEIPEYKQGVVDLSSLLQTKIGDDTTVADMISEYIGNLKEQIDKAGIDPEDIEKQYRKYTGILIESIEDVELKTDSYVSVGDDSVKCTEIRLSVDSKTLKKQLKSLSKQFMKDYGDEINKKLAESGFSNNQLYNSLTEQDQNKQSEDTQDTSEMLKQEDIDKLIDKISDELSGKLILYVNNKADLIGVDIKGSYSATQVGAKVRWEDTADGVSGKISLSLNQISALNISFEVTGDEDKKKSHIRIAPDSFVDTFLGDYQGFAIEIDNVRKKNSDTVTFALIKDGTVYASISESLEREIFERHLLDESAKTVFPVEEITANGYISIPDLICFGLDILDKIGEPALEEKINELLAQSFGDTFSLDTLREMRNNGTLDVFGGIMGPGPVIDDGGNDPSSDPEGGNEDESTYPVGDNTGTDDTGADDNNTGITGDNPYGLNEFGYPAYRTESDNEYPDPAKEYYYSNLELAAYANPGQYKGRIFKKPAPKDVTAESFEKKKQEYLDSLKDVILVDQSTAAVDWGDEVYLDILPYLYGMAIEAFHYDNSYAKIGEDMYGEGLDEKLIGMKVGEVRDITTTLGSQYGDFAGIEATFRVTLKQIERYVKPEWSEEFICGCLGYGSMDECSDMLMNELRDDAEVSEAEIMRTLLDEAIAETDYSYIPDEQYYRLWNRYYNRVSDMLGQEGKTLEEAFAEEGIDAETLYLMLDEDINNNLDEICFYAAVAKQEDIKLTGAELIDIIEHDYLGSGYIDSYEDLMEQIGLQSLIDAGIEEKIDRMILDSAVIE